jgi:phosphoribosylamine--glycine ligase
VKILLLGSGGREHAFAKNLAKSTKISQLYIAPGNAGTADCGIQVSLKATDFEAMYTFCLEKEIDLIVPGPEDPLVGGIVDFFADKAAQGGRAILVAGPCQYAAQLEGSKDFSKAFMLRHGVPTAAAFTVTKDNLNEGYAFLDTLEAPYVLKADGLAAGKGVIITPSLEEAKHTLEEMIVRESFGKASEKVLIEEFLHGIEISVFAVSDGIDWKFLASAKDYKRIGEGDTGLNTGGMGAISPVPFADEVFMAKVANQIATPTFEGLKQEGHPFKGFLFIGLMNCKGEPKVIEYNVRMGDPETESIFTRLQTDMVDLVIAIAAGGIGNLPIALDPRTAATIFLVSGGYPGDIEKGKTMQIPAAIGDCVFYHAGTAKTESGIVTNGGRVLAVTAMGHSIAEARDLAMQNAATIQFEGCYFRRDIGNDLMEYEQNHHD